MQILLNEDEYRMTRLLISDTSINIQFGDVSGEDIKTNVGSPQGDAISGTFFNIALENSLRSLREEMNRRNPEIEHSYVKKSSLPKELI